MWALSSNGAADSIPYCLLEATDLQIKNTFAASSENVTKWIKLIYRGRQMIDSDGFRPNVGIILSRDDGRVFWARRVGQDAWQFPQGGINKDETPEQAMIRELQEETGLLSEHVEIMGQSADWLRYRLPKRYIRKRANDRFYKDYKQGQLDIMAFLKFALKPLSQHSTSTLQGWREDFLRERIRPIALPAAHALVDKHREAGDTLLIITATNRFITGPIAELFGIDNLIATDPEKIDGKYTGKITGTPCFQHGKVERLQHWLDQHQQSLDDSWFYSDSINDLALLEQVSHPVAVDPDERLRAHAITANWSVISLRE